MAATAARAAAPSTLARLEAALRAVPFPAARQAKPALRAPAEPALAKPMHAKPMHAKPMHAKPARAKPAPSVPTLAESAVAARAMASLTARRLARAAASAATASAATASAAAANAAANAAAAAPRAPRRNDPSPSRWRYRLDRLQRRGSVQFALRHLTGPAAALALGAWVWSQEPVWIWIEDQIAAASDAIAARPEFAVTQLDITGGGPRLRALARDEIALTGPVSSLMIDLAALRQRVEALPGVASARLSIGPDGVLRAALIERVPVALWRWEGQLSLIDRDGVVIGPVAARADRPGLPLLIGGGADRAVAEALALTARAAPLADRLRALVRVGERRWSVALDRDQLIELPAGAPESALARVLALDAAEDLLARDALVIDMRLPDRPTLRLSARAVGELKRLRALAAGKDA
jgi:cell division protein FtsQ